MLVEWKKGTTKKFIGTSIDASGTTKRETQEVSFEYPVISTLHVTRVEQITEALASILAENKTGFENLRMLCEHVNYGLLKDVTRQFNQGQDIRYTVAQQQAIKTFRGLVVKGLMKVEETVECLQRQGIQDALAALGLQGCTMDADGFFVEASEPVEG